MKNIEIFKNSSKDINNIKKIGRNVKVIYYLARYGKMGITKINPALVCIDAVVSVGEAFISYNNYKVQKKITKQLEQELSVVKKEFENIKKILEIKEKNIRNITEQQMEEINLQLKNNRKNYEILKAVYEQSEKYLNIIKNNLEEYRREYPASPELKDIEYKYYEAINAHITASIYLAGGG